MFATLALIAVAGVLLSNRMALLGKLCSAGMTVRWMSGGDERLSATHVGGSRAGLRHDTYGLTSVASVAVCPVAFCRAMASRNLASSCPTLCCERTLWTSFAPVP